MSSKIDTNISNYTLSELMAILHLNDMNIDNIKTKTNEYINKYKKSDPKLSTFFLEIQNELLNYAEQQLNNNSNNLIYNSGEKQQNNWYKNEYLSQDNDIQNEKITDRNQKIELFGNEHVPMNRQQLGIANTFQVPIAQDKLNPNLKNTITRFINLDSQFRQYSNNNQTSTDYTLDLSDLLNNVLSIRLYSYQIPYSWYTIDESYGNSCFWISDGNYNIPITINSGNYNPSDFITELNNAFSKSNFTFIDPPVSYNNNSGKIKLSLNGGIYNDGINTFTIDSTTKIIFFDFTGNLMCNFNCVNKTFYLNQSLGWIMGFRVPYVYVDISGNIATSITDLNGTKYLILVVDDYNQNHINNGLVSITEYSNNLKLPNYYSPDLPYTCLPPTNIPNKVAEIIADSNDQSILDNQGTLTNNGLLISGKIETSYSSIPFMLPSAPRTLTNSQLYTINEINKNKNTNTNYRAKAPTSPDILAIIPVKAFGSNTGSLLVEFSGSLQDNIRTYFGPVNIERLRIKLLDDKGNILNLNGSDWCVTLICECLYQY